MEEDDFEVILVDDCSQDSTKSVLQKFKKEKNLKIIFNDQNMGLPSSINKAMQDRIKAIKLFISGLNMGLTRLILPLLFSVFLILVPPHLS